MLLMDFIMSQADRFSGNMHSEKVYLWVENGVLKTKTKKSDPAKAAEQLKQIPPGAVLVDRMIMKDNDAGLISGNSAKSYHLLEKISHMDSKTYDRLLDLQKELQKPEVAQWYQTEILFTLADFNTIKDNVDQAVAILTARKDKGLFLDANVTALSWRNSPRPKPEPDIASTPLAITAPSAVGKRTRQSSSGRRNCATPLGSGGAKLQAPELIRRALMERLGGIAKSNTVAAIEAFQSRFNISIDGLIEPGSETGRPSYKLQAAPSLMLAAPPLRR